VNAAFFPSGAALIAVLLAGCTGGGDCPNPDLCAYAAFKEHTPESADEAASAIEALTDPVVRAAAVQRWMAVHPNPTQQQGARVCGVLPPGEKENCARRVNSPHLHR
jgi:hypothetical protein